MHLTRNTLITIALAIVLVGIAVYFVWGRQSDAPTVTSTSAAPATNAEATFVSLASQLQPIAFDTSILSDPRFTALTDIHTSIVSEAAGRTDPFAPLGVGARLR